MAGGGDRNGSGGRCVGEMRASEAGEPLRKSESAGRSRILPVPRSGLR